MAAAPLCRSRMVRGVPVGPALMCAMCVLTSLPYTHSFLPSPLPLSRMPLPAPGATCHRLPRAAGARLPAVLPMRMAEGDGDSSDSKLDDVAQKRSSNLDAMSDPAKFAERVREAGEMKEAEAQKNLPKVGGTAPAQSKFVEGSGGTSFMSKAGSEGIKKVEADKKQAAEKREQARSSIETMEIDPRGFIVPKVGDIVLCPGKWANQDMVGLVEATQFVDMRMSWNVDVIELTEVAPRTYGKVFSAWKKPAKTWFDVSEVRPARAVYDDAQDGWVVENVRDLYTNPPKVNETARAIANDEYIALKGKILRDTAVLGVGISAALYVVDQGTGVSFAMGSVASLVYLGLLTKQVDEFGPGGMGFFSTRLLAPVGLFAALYLKWALGTEDAEFGSFPSLPPREIAGAAIGFLAYKLPLLYESSKEVVDSLEDAGEGLESGVSQGYKQWQTKVKDNMEEARQRESVAETSINPFTKIRLVVTDKIERDAKEKMAEMEEEKRRNNKDKE